MLHGLSEGTLCRKLLTANRCVSRLAGLAAGGTAGKLGTGIGKRVQGEGRGVAWNVESGTRDMGYEQGLRTWATDMGYGHGTWNTLTLCFVSQVPRTYYWAAPSHSLKAPSSRWIWPGFCSLLP